jgi:hypothetical protein
MAIVRQMGYNFPHPMNSRVTPGSCQKFKLHIYLLNVIPLLSHDSCRTNMVIHGIFFDRTLRVTLRSYVGSKVYPTCLTPSHLMNGLHFQLHPIPSLGVQNYTNTQTRLHSSTLFKILLGSGFEIKCATRIPQSSSSFCQT